MSPKNSAGTVSRSSNINSIVKFSKRFTFFYLGWKVSMTDFLGKLKN